MISLMDGTKHRSRTNAGPRQTARSSSRLANPLLAIGIAIPVAILIGATASAADPPVVPAGETVPASADIKVTVRPMQATTEQIVLSSGRSAVVDLSEPVKRVQVGAPEIAEVKILSPRQILVMGKGAGSTQLILWNEQDGQAVLKVLVQLDAADLQALIPQIAPGAEVQAKVYRDVLILTGTVPDVDSASRIEMIAREYSAKVQNHVKVAGMHQVLLRCTVAEVNKRAIRQLGLNGWLAGDNIRDVFMVSQIGGINPSNIGAGPVGNVIGRGGLPFTNFTGIPLNQSTQFSVGFPRVQMQLFFQALRQNDLLRVLAEPNLIALSGQEAAFLAGGEFPIPVPQGYNGTVTIEWRQYGVRLKFTPTAIGRQMIRLKVAPEVSEQDFTSAVQLAGYVVPALRSRSASTTVEIASGSTIAIAGLLSEQARASAAKVPGLGDVPVLGSLFSSVDYQKNLTELVILVTPELVDSMQPDQVPPVPGQNTLDPTDWELFGLGMVEGRPTPQSGDDAAALETGLAPKYRKFRSPPEQMSLHGPWGPADPAESIQ